MKTQNTPKTAANSQNVRSKTRLAFNPNMNSQIPDISYPPEATRHTPGPWMIWDSGVKRNKVYASDGFQIAVCQSDARDNKESEANARLIAAAPELLEMLKEMALVSIWGRSHPLLAKAQAVIQKAGAGQ